MSQPLTRELFSPHCVISCVGLDGETVLHVRGELDLASEQLLVTAASSAEHDVTVDLSNTDFIDAAGIRALARLAEDCRRRGSGFRITDLRPFHRKLLRDVDLGCWVDTDLIESPKAPDSST